MIVTIETVPEERSIDGFIICRECQCGRRTCTKFIALNGKEIAVRTSGRWITLSCAVQIGLTTCDAILRAERRHNNEVPELFDADI
jgi:hypothetical protein